MLTKCARRPSVRRAGRCARAPLLLCARAARRPRAVRAAVAAAAARSRDGTRTRRDRRAQMAFFGMSHVGGVRLQADRDYDHFNDRLKGFNLARMKQNELARQIQYFSEFVTAGVLQQYGLRYDYMRRRLWGSSDQMRRVGVDEEIGLSGETLLLHVFVTPQQPDGDRLDRRKPLAKKRTVCGRNWACVRKLMTGAPRSRRDRAERVCTRPSALLKVSIGDPRVHTSLFRVMLWFCTR